MSLYDIYRTLTDPNYYKVRAAMDYAEKLQSRQPCKCTKEFIPKDTSMWSSNKLSDEVDKIYEKMGIQRNN